VVAANVKESSQDVVVAPDNGDRLAVDCAGYILSGKLNLIEPPDELPRTRKYRTAL
jgi:hypothetical protein